jgi:hypothetical protein
VATYEEWKYWKDLSDLARTEMARLEGQGLTDLDPVSEDTPQGADEQPLTPKTLPVRLDKNQIVWVQPHSTHINDFGYRPVEVSGEPPRSDFAIVAALTALLAFRTRPPEAVRMILPFLERRKAGEPHLGDILTARFIEEPRYPGHRKTATLGSSPNVQEVHFEYLKDLLHHYRPGFDEMPPEEQIALVEHTSRYVNKFWEALRKLMEFVEYGSRRGTISPAVKNAARDVWVAQLHEVAGLSYVKIAKILKEPPPKTFTEKNDHPKVRKMADRGKRILERVFGKEGWEEKVATMKEEVERWRSLSEGQKMVERIRAVETGSPGVSLEEARARTWREIEEQAKEHGLTREEAARRWAERYTPKILTDYASIVLREDKSE